MSVLTGNKLSTIGIVLAICVVIVSVFAYSQISILQKNASNLETDKNYLQNQVVTLTADKANLENQVTTLENQVDTLSTDKATLENQAANLQNEISELQFAVSYARLYEYGDMYINVYKKTHTTAGPVISVQRKPLTFV